MVRAGSEQDLVEELGDVHRPEILAEGLVVSASRPRGDANALTDLGFARQAMLLDGPPAPIDVEPLADRVASAIRARLPKKAAPWTWSLQIVPPDSSDPHDVRRAAMAQIAEPMKEALEARLPEDVRGAEVEAGADRIVQVWAIDETSCLVGVTSTADALSSAAGGRVRMRRPDDAPSRAGLKLEEAIAWIGLGPERGDLCVDLGASPGGWSQVAVRRGANVIAVDPAPVRVDLPKAKFTQVLESAFDFAPAQTFDWLLCDMAWRPLEVAMLISKWGRRVWGRQLIVNFKLPMRKKAEILARVKKILEEGGWRGIRTRQLYFDRDEVTVFAWLDPNVARRGLQAPFQLRSRAKRAEDEASGKARQPREHPRRERDELAPRGKLARPLEGRRSGGPRPAGERRALGERSGEARGSRSDRRPNPSTNGPRSGAATRPKSPTRSGAATRPKSPTRSGAGTGGPNPRSTPRGESTRLPTREATARTRGAGPRAGGTGPRAGGTGPRAGGTTPNAGGTSKRPATSRPRSATARPRGRPSGAGRPESRGRSGPGPRPSGPRGGRGR